MLAVHQYHVTEVQYNTVQKLQISRGLKYFSLILKNRKQWYGLPDRKINSNFVW